MTELLTGEKAARDVLSLSDYLAAARRGTGQVIRRSWWVIAATAILAAGIIYAGSYLHTIPDLIRVVGSIAWLAGAAGLFSKAASVVLGQGVIRTEGWLWQIELDGSVAAAATCLPPGAKKSPAGGSSVGALTPDPSRAAEHDSDTGPGQHPRPCREASVPFGRRFAWSRGRPLGRCGRPRRRDTGGGASLRPFSLFRRLRLGRRAGSDAVSVGAASC